MIIAAAGLAAGLCCPLPTVADDPAPPVDRLLRSCGIEAGLIVHAGCRDAATAAALCRSERILVHALTADRTTAQRVSDELEGCALKHRILVEYRTDRLLPYADNLVNLLVVEPDQPYPAAELMRVLVPGGTVCVRSGDKWTQQVKPRPAELDDWGHYLHGPDNNAVSRDKLIGPARLVQWVADPAITHSHEHTPGIAAVVSSGGRLYYFENRAEIASIHADAEWYIMARDAFNGMLLWQRPMGRWFPKLFSWTRVPQTLQRRLVATEDTVYATEDLYGPVLALEARTGKQKHVFAGSEGAEEILLHRDTLLLVVREPNAARKSAMQRLTVLSRPKSDRKPSPLFDRKSRNLEEAKFTAAERQATLTLMAYDARTGARKWARAGPDVAAMRETSLAVSADRLVFLSGSNAVCCALATGAPVWTRQVPAPAVMVLTPDAVVCAQEHSEPAAAVELAALALADGRPLWRQPTSLHRIRDLFVINDAVWLGGCGPDQGKRRGWWFSYMVRRHRLTDGKEAQSFNYPNPGHHHRCYRSKASERHILGGRRGTEFIELGSQRVEWQSWARGTCKYGVMPANGLLYTPPHACSCYATTRLMGFYALAPAAADSISTAPAAAAALEKGPAYLKGATNREHGAEQYAADWPAYRADAARSAATAAKLTPSLRETWRRPFANARLSAPTAAFGKVFVADRNHCRVYALNAEDGAVCWSFVAGGEVDSPPALVRVSADHEPGNAHELCIFGARDGYAYALRATDGVLAWRFRAGGNRRIIARGRLESDRPLFGSPLFQDGAVFITAGRSSHLQHGIDLYRLDPLSAAVQAQHRFENPPIVTGARGQKGKRPKREELSPNRLPGSRADILSGDRERLYMLDCVFDNACTPVAKLEEGVGEHLTGTGGMLLDAYAQRDHMVIGRQAGMITGSTFKGRYRVAGRLFAFNDQYIYGYGRRRRHWSDATSDARPELFRLPRAGGGKGAWRKPRPGLARGLLLAGSDLFVVEGPSEIRPTGKRTGKPLLVAVSSQEGEVISEYPLPACPVFDAMAAVPGRLFLSLADGSIVCMASVPTP